MAKICCEVNGHKFEAEGSEAEVSKAFDEFLKVFLDPLKAALKRAEFIKGKGTS